MKIFRMETKKLALWLVIIFGASALISGIFLLASGLPASIRTGEDWPAVGPGDGTEFSIDESREFPVDGLEELEIDLSFENTSIVGIDGDSITVHYFGMARPARDVDEVFFAEQTGTVLTLESHWGGVPVRDGRITLELGIPAGAGLALNFSGASGNLDAVDLELVRLDARLGSGNIDISDLRSGPTVVKVSSGSLNLNDIRSTGALELNASSGRIEGNDLSATLIEGKNTSGNISLKNISGDFDMHCSSGSLQVDFLKPGNKISASASSGRVEVGLPAGTEFALNARASSGSIRSDFPIAISGSMNKNRLEGMAGNGGSRTVTLKSSSGNIALKELP